MARKNGNGNGKVKEAQTVTTTENVPAVPSGGNGNLPTNPASLQLGRGFENGYDREDLIIPRVKLLQPLSPEVQEDGSQLRAGQMINSITKQLLPNIFIPVFFFKEYLRFNAREADKAGWDANFAPGALMWKTADPNDPRVAQAQFGPNGEKPLAQAVLNFFTFFPGEAMPLILSFAKTNYKTGKKLISLARFQGGDMFAKKYKLSAHKESNDSGTFWVFDVEPAGIGEALEYQQGEQLWSDFSSKTDQIKVHDVEAEEATATAETGARPY